MALNCSDCVGGNVQATPSYLAVLVFACLAASAVVVVICARCILRRVDLSPHSRRQHQVEPASAPPSPDTVTADDLAAIEEAQRKERLIRNMILRKWGEPAADDRAAILTMEMRRKDEDDGKTIEDSSCLSSLDQVDSSTSSDSGCAICLSKFRKGQIICQSNNVSCKHIYHAECLLHWFFDDKRKTQTTTDPIPFCPICRAVYVLDPTRCPSPSDDNV